AAREHGRDLLGHRLPSWILRRIHAVDHPVARAAAPAARACAGRARAARGFSDRSRADRKQRVARVETLAVQSDLDLARLPLQALVGAAVPDQDLPRPVLSLRDLALEVEVLERVLLGDGGEAVVVG